jgi:hypothetical protein
VSRRLKVAADKQIVYNGKHYFAATPSPWPMTIQKWIATSNGDTSRPPPRVGETRKANKRKRTENHYVAQYRGLDPQGLDGLDTAPPETQEH